MKWGQKPFKIELFWTTKKLLLLLKTRAMHYQNMPFKRP